MTQPTPAFDALGAQLQHMRDDLLAQLRAQRGGSVGRAEAAAEARTLATGDWAQDDAQRDLTFALEEREAAELSAIDAALQRIANGNYGQCTDCGVDIAPARLQANPVALRCIQCQDGWEHRHGEAPPPKM